MSIDPRLIERRKTVAEDHAKRNMSRLLKFLAVACLAGGAVWLVFSPWLSVSQVNVTGVAASDAYTILADSGVVAGTPMIRVSAANAEADLMADPWIADADVDLQWPDRVSVEVVERVPVAWAETAGGWARRAVDGVALPSADDPDATMVHVVMPDLADVAATTSPDLVGALEFAAALPSHLEEGTQLTVIDGELWATVSGFGVRLGRGVDMTEKARSLEALLSESLPKGSVIVLIAPTNPSVLTPQGAAAASKADSEESAGDEADAGGGNQEAPKEEDG